MDAVFIHPSAVVDPPGQIGPGTRIWHFAHVMSGAVIGRDCVLGQGVFIGAGVRIGAGCKIQNQVSIFTGVELADEVFVGPAATFTNVRTPRAGVVRNTPAGRSLTRVSRGASIGANATLVCPVAIGAYAMVAAGAVVTADVPAHALVVGNPARQVGWVCVCGARLPGGESELVCGECGQAHRRAGAGLEARGAGEPGPG